MLTTKLDAYSIPDSLYSPIVPTRGDCVVYGSRTGEPVPGFRDKIKAGQDASSSYYERNAYRVHTAVPSTATFAQYFLHLTLGPINWTFPEVHGYWQSVGQHGFDHVASPSAAADAKAINRLHEKIRNYRSSANGAVFLGELAETLRMIRRPAAALFKGTDEFMKTIQKIRRRAVRGVKKRPFEPVGSYNRRLWDAVKNATAGSWLEYQFGVKPLVSDITELATTALELDTERFRKTRFVGNSDPEVAYQSSVNSQNSSMDGSGTLRQFISYQRWTTCSVRYKAGFHASHASLSGPFRALQQFGLTFENLVPALYEVAPWSFLIDYFSNLGDIINATFTGTDGLQYCTKTVLQKTVFICNERYAPYQYGVSSWNATLRGGNPFAYRQFERVTLTRTRVTGGLPIPPLIFTVPGEDSLKWANLAALAAQMFNFDKRSTSSFPRFK